MKNSKSKMTKDIDNISCPKNSETKMNCSFSCFYFENENNFGACYVDGMVKREVWLMLEKFSFRFLHNLM